MWLSAMQKLFSPPGSWETSGCSTAVPKTWLGNKQGGTSLVPVNEKLPGSSWTLARDPVLQTKMIRKSGLEDNPKGNPTLQHSSARKGTALLAGFFQKPVNATRGTRRMEELLQFPVVTSSNSKSSQESELLQISKTLLQKREHCGQFQLPFDIISWKVKNCGYVLLSELPPEIWKKSATKRLIQQIFDKLQPNTLKSRQICLNTCGFYSKMSRHMETVYYMLAWDY